MVVPAENHGAIGGLVDFVVLTRIKAVESFGEEEGCAAVCVRDRRRGTMIPPFLYLSVFFLVERGERDVRDVCGIQ